MTEPDDTVGSVDEFIITPSGFFFLRGWTDDFVDPSDRLRLNTDSIDVEFESSAVRRYRREDVEAHFNRPYDREYGFWVFDSFKRQTAAIRKCAVAVNSTQWRLQPSSMGEAAMKGRVLGFLGNLLEGDSARRALRDLNHGIGTHLITLNRSIPCDSSHVSAYHFDGGQRRVKRTLVIWLRNRAHFLSLQLALLLKSKGLDETEILYVNSNPDVCDVVQHEAKRSAYIYKLPITVIHTVRGVSETSARNIAAQYANSNRLLFLDPYIIPRDQNWLVVHDEFVKTEEGALFGACLYAGDGSIAHAGSYFELDTHVNPGFEPLHLIRIEHFGKAISDTPIGRPRVVPGVHRAFMSIDRKHFESLGGFDAGYMSADYADADLCLRSSEVGQPAWCNEALRMWYLDISDRPPTELGATFVNRWHFTNKWLSTVSYRNSEPIKCVIEAPSGR